MGNRYMLTVKPLDDHTPETYISFEAKDDQDARLKVRYMLDLRRQVPSVPVPIALVDVR